MKNEKCKKSEADFTAREIYFANVSKGTAFLLQGILETIPEEERPCRFELTLKSALLFFFFALKETQKVRTTASVYSISTTSLLTE